MIKNNNDIEVVKQEWEEEKEISQKSIEIIKEKDEEINNWKKRVLLQQGERV